MSAIGQAIRNLREERGWTQSQLGELVGIDGTNVARRETGRTRVRSNERFLFAKAFGMNVIDFDEHWRQWEVARTQGGPGIPIINRAPAGLVTDYEEYGVDSGQGYEYVDYGSITDRHAFGVVVVGDSMQPRLNEGDYVILSPCDPYRGDGKLASGAGATPGAGALSGGPGALPGAIVFVRFTVEHGGGCMLARFFIEPDGRIRFQKDNPAYAATVCDREAVQSLAVAVERRERLTSD
jgi:transcriptional regulator with XRE-family HTH domain